MRYVGLLSHSKMHMHPTKRVHTHLKITGTGTGTMWVEVFGPKTDESEGDMKKLFGFF